MLKNKNIILGITGSIAAYKAAMLIRLLVTNGANVKVIVTPLAKEFITPVTLATLSKNTVLCDFFHHDDGTWNSHVELGLWADLMLIAPATANTIAKMANGICDNLLLTSYLSVRCPVMIAPAMDFDMFKHPATQKNIETLKSFGNIIIEPTEGELASGLHGKGRMKEPADILKDVVSFFDSKKKLINKTILVTAGPTYEKIDPVRFIGNHSSGKMGYNIAECLAENGAKVELISGPVSMNINHENIHLTKVTSAEEMYNVSISHFQNCDIAIMSAAVADFTPKTQVDSKIKNKTENLVLELIPTKDIALELGKMKKKNQLLIGFALETDNELENAKKKITSKNLDFIVLNSLKDTGAGFKHDTNKITIIDKNNNIEKFELKTKREVASDIVNKIIKLIT
ncbi:MAG TPA: bifunctional phosphopantothenoylcysteine decarboxylase/phosphopantothenate--cysteine ligase CoaBC [Bacteroidales bacterium]|nr:MAG: phosphopantothenoylcysteine decarboxylase [Bacteroidetes bacterium GWF2_33_38]OFY76542.1 MAG: phosphopantothenoylcysteine decarboxylase [Bacteroidetes bacterium RIFOXYA12_FULL_33_9]OFY87517.1 MAG: phosphopantothenoylcysteine decarboxylase [Bacteroidetes bacterium RIFOXYA2_FULL_33_7]HBF87273.1 bifunctional phosphopantothenoylcysteine decarboxylase/phosphopantothenate--cysteine ligase CoaBC [Bacteroidales bacterium]